MIAAGMPDTYVLVTGASSGLGAEIASRLAADHRRGVILSGRNAQRLQPIADRLARETPGARTVIMTADLSELDGPRRLYEQIRAQNLIVDELVNNAGASAPGSALDLDPDTVISEMILDYVSAAALTMLFLRHFQAAGLQEGRVVQILSMAARFKAMPNFAHYNSAKKAFDAFSRGIEYEIKRAGLPVRVYRVYPGAISGTKIATSDITERNKGLALPASEVARIVVEGSRRGKRVIVPGLPNRLAHAVAPALPQWLTDRIFYQVYGRA